jgi:hypothetical protein
MKRAITAALAAVAILVLSAPSVPAQVPLCAYCCDAYGNVRCGGNMALPCGSSCFCPGQGYGYAC